MVNRVSRSPRSRLSGTAPYDAVIVGAGHNGLVCAAYLAKAGHRVAIVERRDTVGGACVTDELFPGYRFCTASLVSCLFRQEIIAELDLTAHGLEILAREPSVVALFPDGRTLALGADMEAATAEIKKFSERDAATYADFGETMRRLARFAAPYLLGKSRTPLFDDMPALRNALGAASGLPDDDLGRLVKALFGSARSVLDDWFESDQLKTTLATDGVVGVNAGPSMPGTGYLMLYHQMGATESARPSWGQVKGGMGGITQALASVCAAHGADIITGATVRKIRVASAGAEGVELEDGRLLHGRVIISAAAPKTTFLDLVDSEAVPSGYRHAIVGMDVEGTASKLHLALDRLPEIRGLPGESAEYRGTLQILPSMDHFDAAYAESRLGRPSSEPHVECTIPTLLDPSLAPPGKHVMSMYVQFTPYTLAGATWDEIKESFADRVLEYVEPYLPGLTASVLNRKILSPRDLERELALPGGHLYHGAMSPRDMFAGRPVAGYADYHTPVPGLYLCAAGTRPGGGVFGMPGKNASDVARQHLEDDHGRR
jgi:phytoene dehydrogenase-like protein